MREPARLQQWRAVGEPSARGDRQADAVRRGAAHRSDRFRGGWRLSVVVVLLAAGFLSQADDTTALTTNTFMQMSFDELLEVKVDRVVAASRHEQKLSQAPAGVSIVTSDEIDKFGYRTLPDLLRGVNGLHVTSDRNYSYLGVRGFGRPSDYNARVLVLVDGHRLNENIYDSALLGTEFPLDLDLVERVEVIRGPGSPLYGNNAFFGVINVVTKSGAQLDGLRVSGEAGSWDTYKGVLSYGKKYRSGLELLVSGSFYGSAGPSELPFPPSLEERIPPSPVAHDMDADRYYHGFLKLAFGGFTLEGYYGHREKRVPTANWGTVFDDPRYEATDELGGVDLRFLRHFGEDWELSARAYVDGYFYAADYPYADESDPGSTYVTQDETHGNWWGTEWLLTKTLMDRHRLTVGAEYRHNFRQDQEYSAPDLPDGHWANFGSGHIVGVFGQAEVGLLTNLWLNLGLRYDYDNHHGDSLNPRLALIYQPLPESTLKLLYGEAFRAPNIYEASYDAPGNLANPNLESETIDTYEFIYEQELPWNLRFTSSFYHYAIDRLIDPVETADGELRHENVDQIDAFGIELGLEKRWQHGGRLRLGYTVQQAKNQRTGEVISNCPRQLAQLHLIVPLYRDKLHAGLETLFVDSVQTAEGRALSDYTLLNLTLFSRKLVPGLEVSGSVYNLLDSDSDYPVGTEHPWDAIPADGRSFRMKLAYQF